MLPGFDRQGPRVEGSAYWTFNLLLSFFAFQSFSLVAVEFRSLLTLTGWVEYAT